MVAVKVCGITRREDIDFCIDNRVSALGFIFAESPRQVSLQQVKKMAVNLPPFISTVAVVVNPGLNLLNAIIESYLFDYIQFHGEENPELLSRVPQKTIKAFSIRSKEDLLSIHVYNKYADYFLFDARTENRKGGTGLIFPWHLLTDIKISKPYILAGGIGPENIIKALKATAPAAIDLNSKVEKTAGIKDHKLIRETMLKVEYWKQNNYKWR